MGYTFDPEKFSHLDLTFDDDTKDKIKTLGDTVERMNEEQFAKFMSQMEGVVTAENKKKAFLENAEFVANIVLAVLGRALIVG